MKRWPIIRHIRWLYYDWRVHQHAATWGSIGIGLGHPNQSDLDYLKLIWEGKEP